MADFSVCYEFKRKINKIGLMYKVSKNIKILSFSLMIIGALGLAFSFYSAPKTIEQAKEMVADSHGDDHGAVSFHSVEDLHYEKIMLTLKTMLTLSHTMNIYFINCKIDLGLRYTLQHCFLCSCL